MRKKIMVVDDEPDVRASVVQILKPSGYTILEGENGNDCMQKLKRETPDLFILDIMMPGMSGWDVAAQIKGNEKLRNIPIIFLTAKSDEMSIGMGHIAAVEYIVKPFDIIDLKRKVEKVFKNKK